VIRGHHVFISPEQMPHANPAQSRNTNSCTGADTGIDKLDRAV